MKRTSQFQKCFSVCVLIVLSSLVEAYRAAENLKPADDSHDTGKQNGKEKKVYTNDDLDRLRKTQRINQSDSKDIRPTKQRDAATDLQKYRDSQGHDREYWQQKIHPLRSKLILLDSKMADLENQKKDETATSGLKVSKSGKLNSNSGDSRAKLERKIDEIKLQRSQVLRDIDDLEERGRKSGALPEWLR